MAYDNHWPISDLSSVHYSTREEALAKRYRYCDDDAYKSDAYQSLSSQFKDCHQFETFYSSLKDPKTKDEFLRVGSAYLFFVKKGDWRVNISRSKRLVSYLTNSFKLVALLAIIESLSEEKNVDFFEWLLEAKNQKDVFPITDERQLRKLYADYKLEYGSIRRCKLFFSNLSQPTKDRLCKAILVDEKPIEKIEDVVETIYKARSAFAHECDAVLEVSDSWCFFREGNKRFSCKLPMELLQEAFEEGVVAHFKRYSH
jgi:hypothetical protein